MKKRELEAATNNAVYWHSFAYLACVGKRTVQDFAFANLGGAKEADEAARIKAEAQQVNEERKAASQNVTADSMVSVG